MRFRSLALALLLTASAHAAPRRVVFVDNRVEPGGAGSQRQPYSTIAEAASHGFDVMFVAETGQPYPATLTLQRGQMLVGSAYGLDAIRAEMQVELDAPGLPAAKGPGPLIQGTVTLTGDNVVAGVTIASSAAAAISTVNPTGPLSILSTWIRTSSNAVGMAISGADVPVTITGGGLTSAGGSGLTLYAGRGDIIFDRFGVEGTFTNAIDIRGRGGRTVFRGKAVLDVADALQSAVNVAACTAAVDFEVPLRIAAKGRGLSITQSSVTIKGDGSRVTASGAFALEIRDSAVEGTLSDVSASGGDRGIVIDKLRGALVIAGGTISGVRTLGVDVTQSSGLRLLGLTLNGAAMHLRHVSGAELEKITIIGAKAAALHANNISNVKFSDLVIRDSVGAALLLDELKDSVQFARCTVENAGGGALVLTQQFNTAKVVFDRCAFSAAAKPTGAAQLAVLRVSGGKLEVELRNVEMHDNAGSALLAEAKGSGRIDLKVADARIERLGRAAIELAARDQGRAAFLLRGTTIATPGNLDLPAVDVAASGGASACADFSGNQIVTGSAVPVRLGPAVAACH